VYRNATTGEVTQDVAPSGTVTMCDKLLRDGHGDLIGSPTHFVSLPFTMRFRDVVAATKGAVATFEKTGKTAFLWLDVLSIGYHHSHFVVSGRGPAISKGGAHPQWIEELREGIRNMPAGMVQLCTAWNDPERVKRLWLMLESYIAVTTNQQLAYAMAPHEETKLADELRAKGPEAILGAVMNMETDPQRGEVAHEPDRKPLLQAMAQLASDSEYTKEAMSEKLSNLTRKAFAGAAERQFQTEMELCKPIFQSSANLSDVLDLGHQWRCSGQARTVQIVRRISLNKC
jgi:hypothetical protein